MGEATYVAQMAIIRLAEVGDLPSLLALYGACGFSEYAPPEDAPGIWQAILERDGTDVVVAVSDGQIVSSCTLITAPNLLRGGQSHGFLENVATHPGHRGLGYGRDVVRFALARAWREGCFHVMMQSGRKDAGVHEFYRKQGFAPGLRTAYVIHRHDCV